MSRTRFARLVVGSLIFILVISAFSFNVAAQPTGLGGPVILMGLDSELSPLSSNHGSPQQHCTMVSALFSHVHNDGSGIVVIGRRSTRVIQYWQQVVGGCINEPVTFLETPGAIAAVDFSDNGSGEPYAMIGVASSYRQLSSFEGVDDALNSALILRRFDIADFVNGGGGLLGKTQYQLVQPWGYLDPLGDFLALDIPGSGYSQVLVTQAGQDLGLSQQAMSGWCCYHEVFETFPPFFDALITHNQGGQFHGMAAAIGGLNVVLPGAIELDPADATNQILPGATHTVTALVRDGDLDPLEGETVEFEITSGPNEGETGSDVTDSSGEATFTYQTNLEAGTDVIQASFTDGLGVLRTTTATKTWELIPITISFEKQWIDDQGDPLPPRDATVTANGDVVCEDGDCPGTLVLDPGDSYTVSETEAAGWESVSGIGAFTAPYEDFTHIVVNQVLPGEIELGPTDVTNQILPGATHTITAQVQDSNSDPLEGETVDFEIISGPNAGQTGDDLVDGSGEATFSYASNLEAGTDVIQASFTDELGILRTTTATKTWELVPVTISFEKQWIDDQGDPLPPRDATVTANGDVVCEASECPGTLVLDPGDSYTVAETEAAGWENVSGTGAFTAPWEDFTHVIVNQVLPGDIELSPPDATNPIVSGAMHTVTALVRDSNLDPLEGETVEFEITSGPNEGETGSDETDSSGEAIFTYPTNGEEGTDGIEATFTDPLGNIRTATATKTWERIAITISFEKQWIDQDGNQLASRNATVTANEEVVCEDGDCPGTLEINPGETYTVEESGPEGWTAIQGTGEYVTGEEDFTHVIVNQIQGECVDLIAGQHTVAGEVCVINDDDTLYVTYNTTGGWMLGQTHLVVSGDEPGGGEWISQPNRWQNPAGNPAPGRFPHSASHDASVDDTGTYALPLSSITGGVGPGDGLSLGAHAEVYHASHGKESAWGDGEQFVQRGNWAMHFAYTVR